MKHFTILFAAFAFAFSVTTAQTNLTTAVDFTITDLEGNSHNLFDYLDSGQYVCIDFFAYWCGPCQATAPEFNNVYHQYGCNDGDVTFLSIELEGTDAIVHDFEVAYAGDYPPPAASGAEGGGGAVLSAYGIGAFPTYILISPDHSIVEQDIWPMDAIILNNVLQSYNLTQMNCTNSVEEAISEFTIFPVPASDIVNVELQEVGAEINLINLLGANVITTIATETRTQLNVSSLEAGSYFVRVTLKGEVRTQAIQIFR
jgi:thiol-disulfide isomerase/thioredoxin